MCKSHLNIFSVHICIGEVILSFTITYLDTTIDKQSTIMNMCN